MSHFLFVILFLFRSFHFIINNKLLNEQVIEYYDPIIIKKDLSQTYYIDYKRDTQLSFEIEGNDTHQINIHSINCNLRTDFPGEIINQINLDIYTLKMNKTCNNVTIKPIIDITDGEDKENYDKKKCLLYINNINLNEPKIKLENKTDSLFFFQRSNLNLLNISYNIKEVSEKSFIALLFQFNENSNFSIEAFYVCDNGQTNNISKNIQNSTFLFLNANFLLYNKSNGLGGNLELFIKTIDNKGINIHFKIIEKDIISIIEKNALNYGFLTSETRYQYYYMEVFRGEEGELMLHNKRLYGILYAKVIEKKDINDTELNNISNYPTNITSDIDSKYLDYNPHSLQLKYKFEDTSNCLDGCYILITYEQKLSEGDFPLIGYEFTLLSRAWNYTDYIPQIVEIPFNEYLIGAFEKGSISQHYYSFFIPDEAEKIIFQIEGNYIEGYYGEGRQKINTMRPLGNIQKLEIINNQNVITLNKNQFNFTDKAITIAIRPIDYFTDVFSFYYLRILYIKEGDKIYFPIDSNLGNLCLPEYDNISNTYNCYSIFKNNYNELATRFSVSSSNMNEYFKIKVTKFFKNGTTCNEENEFVFIYNDFSNDVDFYLFKYEFNNGEIKNIISSLCDNIQNINPQIYSSQMFYIFNFTKISYFKLKYNYTVNYKYIHGAVSASGIMDISFLNFKSFYSSRNFRGKPFSIDLDRDVFNISFKMKNNELLFYFRLIYNMRNKGIEEIQSGETKSIIMTKGSFPLYYYLKIKDEKYINLDINLRLNSFDDAVMKNNFDIKGYLLNEDSIKRKVEGEYIKLPTAKDGFYSNRYKVGLLQINQMKSNNNSDDYLLIEIINLDQLYIHSELLVELVAKEYFQDFYFMPINQYIIETFDDINNTIRNKNQYYININQRGESQVLIELSPEYNDIELQFINKTNSSEFLYSEDHVTGFKKYRIKKSDTDNVYFNIINPNKRNANYFIRYYYTNQRSEYIFIFNENPQKEIIESNNENVSVSLTFDAIKIIYKEAYLNTTNKISFYISGLLYNKNDNSEELLNTTSILHEQICLYENKTIYIYKLENPEKFTLLFKNISRKHNYNYDLQLQANLFSERNMFNEEFLIFMTKVDLTDIQLKEEESILWFILGPILVAIGLAIIAFFVIKYIRLQKANVNLQEEMKSMAYSNDIQKNVIVKNKKKIESESDYDTTFI